MIKIDCQGDWQPLITDELFDRVQLVLDGRRPSPKRRARRVRPEFPLKGFVRCAHCDTALTGESKKGGRLLYYRCWNTKCSAGTKPTRVVDDAFAALLDSIRPRPEYVRLFREIVQREHRDAHQTKGDERHRLEQRRDELQTQKKNLGRELARGILDADAYRELREDIDAELAEVRVALADTTTEEIDVEAILDFAEELFLDPAKMWRALNPEQKRIFQNSMFPEGVHFDGTQLRTPVTASFMAELGAIQEGETRLASPTGFEPVLPP